MDEFDNFDRPIMDRARARLADEEPAPTRPGPIAGPPRMPSLAVARPFAFAVAVGLLVCLWLLFGERPAPLGVPTPTITPPQAASAPALRPGNAATLAGVDEAPAAVGGPTVPAWWSPGGEAAPDVAIASIIGVFGRCYAHPGLRYVLIAGGGEVWVDAVAAGIDWMDEAQLGYIGDGCQPPPPPPAVVQAAPVAPAAPAPVEAAPVEAQPTVVVGCGIAGRAKCAP